MCYFRLFQYTLSNLPITAIITPTPPKCYGEATGSIEVSNVQNAEPPILYSVSGAPLAAANPITALVSGTYTVVVQDVTGCSFSASTTISDAPRFDITVGRDTALAVGDSLFMRGAVSFGTPLAPVQYFWTCGAEVVLSSPNADSTTAYIARANGNGSLNCRLVLTDARGCSAADALTIRLKDANSIFIPNAFTPNADGINDEWVIFGGATVARVDIVRVFDRWGELVHQRSDIAPNTPIWDGLLRQAKAAPGVYVYYAEIRMLSGEVLRLTGDVTVLH